MLRFSTDRKPQCAHWARVQVALLSRCVALPTSRHWLGFTLRLSSALHCTMCDLILFTRSMRSKIPGRLEDAREKRLRDFTFTALLKASAPQASLNSCVECDDGMCTDSECSLIDASALTATVLKQKQPSNSDCCHPSRHGTFGLNAGGAACSSMCFDDDHDS